MAITAWGGTTSDQRGLSDFRATMSGGGARPNLFGVGINFPEDIPTAGASTLGDTTFFVKSAGLPASNLGTIEVPYLGMQFKVAGDRTFDPWTITVINDTDFVLRNAFERWVNFINTSGGRAGLTNPNQVAANRGYTCSLSVWQLTKAELGGGAGAAYSVDPTQRIESVRGYELHGCWPTNVSTIDLAYDSNDTIEEFTVEFQVSWMEGADIDPTSGNALTLGDSGLVPSVN